MAHINLCWTDSRFFASAATRWQVPAGRPADDGAMRRGACVVASRSLTTESCSPAAAAAELDGHPSPTQITDQHLSPAAWRDGPSDCRRRWSACVCTLRRRRRRRPAAWSVVRRGNHSSTSTSHREACRRSDFVVRLILTGRSHVGNVHPPTRSLASVRSSRNPLRPSSSLLMAESYIHKS